MAFFVFGLHLAIYHLNGDFLPINDATFSTYLPRMLLTHGSFSVTPAEAPSLFNWIRRTPQGPMLVHIDRWDESMNALRQRGELVLRGAKYYVTPSVRKDSALGERRYVNTFGPGPGLLALPVVALAGTGGNDLLSNRKELWFAGKFVASALVAGSVAFVFLAARILTERRWALIIAAAYGLGTCVWSISSQALWQHGPNELFLAMGTYFLLKTRERRSFAWWCGLAFALAVACRPSSVLAVVAVGGYLLCTDRKALAGFCIAGLPVALALGAYNAYYHGSAFSFGRAGAGSIDQQIALAKTRSGDVWQTPLHEGAAGLLFSPARGLLIYSPFMLFAFGGLYQVWRDPRYAALRPLALATVALFLVACKWFDWWGGWCFGYRPIVDLMPFLAVLLVPVFERLGNWRTARIACGLLLAWSVGVQVIGAFAYESVGWNARLAGFEVKLPGRAETLMVSDRAEVDRLLAANPGTQARERRLDIDSPDHRSRLWSVADNPILYYAANFAASRAAKTKNMDSNLD
jgi:hypothetical protein